MTTDLDAFLDAIVKAHSEMDITQCWPAHPAQIEASISDLIAMRLFHKYQQNKSKFFQALNHVRIDSVRTYLYQAGLVGLKVARVHPKLGHKITIKDTENYLLNALKALQKRIHSDVLCRDKKNLLSSAEQIRNLIQKQFVTKLSAVDQREIANLNVTAESLSWAMFYDMYRSGGFVIHGPYETSEGKLLVRENTDLNPPFWPFKSEYQNLKIFLLYDQDIEISCDFANHFTYRKPILYKLKAYRIENNGRVIDSLTRILELTHVLEKYRSQHVKHIESLSPSQIISKGAEISAYLFKNLWEYYDEDWHPSQETYHRIDTDGLKYWQEYQALKDQKERPPEYYRRLYDPRNDFIG